MSRLCAWKIPVSVPFLDQWLDHTYVTCDNPSKSWPCWGRGEGGENMGCVEGSYSTAECLSQKRGLTGPAEIVYGINGVCHQTANRILYPNMTVAGVGGYPLSWLLFDTYGTCHPWPPYYPVLIASGIRWYFKHRECGVRASVTNYLGDDKAKLHSQEIISLHSSWDKLNASSETENLKIIFDKEQELTMNYLFGNESEFIPEAIKIRLASLEEKVEWDKELLDADITHENHATEVNAICGNLARQISDVVGIDEFKKIFGLSPPKDSINIVVPEIATKLDEKKSL